jgi:hypothetical protein
MLTKLHYTVSLGLLQQALLELPKLDTKLALNQPTGNFFYDPWGLKSEFVGTIWEELYNTLPETKGEARLIKLDPGETYLSHADIDDRWHLNISGEQAFLTDLQYNILHSQTCNGSWYSMDAGIIHSAVNLGAVPRIQFVVRKLLTPTHFDDLVAVTITPAYEQFDYRYRFDNIISPWLNRKNTQGVIKDFSYRDNIVSFKLYRPILSEFEKVVTERFQIEYQ